MSMNKLEVLTSQRAILADKIAVTAATDTRELAALRHDLRLVDNLIVKHADDMAIGMSKVGTSREKFDSLARSIGSTAIDEENAILSVGREFLPPCAITVLDGGEPTDEYWDFLISETQKAQDEHDREVAEGHEWHASAKQARRAEVQRLVRVARVRTAADLVALLVEADDSYKNHPNYKRFQGDDPEPGAQEPAKHYQDSVEYKNFKKSIEATKLMAASEAVLNVLARIRDARKQADPSAALADLEQEVSVVAQHLKSSLQAAKGEAAEEQRRLSAQVRVADEGDDRIHALLQRLADELKEEGNAELAEKIRTLMKEAGSGFDDTRPRVTYLAKTADLDTDPSELQRFLKTVDQYLKSLNVLNDMSNELEGVKHDRLVRDTPIVGEIDQMVGDFDVALHDLVSAVSPVKIDGLLKKIRQLLDKKPE